MPRSVTGKASTSAPVLPGQRVSDDADMFVYITTDVDLAWVYAYAARGRGKPKVLTVEPLGPVMRDPEHSYDMPTFRTFAARVLAVSTEPTITEDQAVSGWLVEGGA